MCESITTFIHEILLKHNNDVNKIMRNVFKTM